MAAAQETMAAASTCLHAGEAAGEELFRLAARLNAKRVQYQPGGLYTNPYQKDERSVSAIKESFSAAATRTCGCSRNAIWRTHRMMSRKRLRSRKRKPGECCPSHPAYHGICAMLNGSASD